MAVKNCRKLTDDLKNHLESEGYQHICEIPGRGVCGLKRFAFTVGLVYGLDNTGYSGRYCYHSHSEALNGLNNWQGADNPPSGNWIKHKGYSVDELNPNYVKNEG